MVAPETEKDEFSKIFLQSYQTEHETAFDDYLVRRVKLSSD